MLEHVQMGDPRLIEVDFVTKRRLSGERSVELMVSRQREALSHFRYYGLEVEDFGGLESYPSYTFRKRVELFAEASQMVSLCMAPDEVGRWARQPHSLLGTPDQPLLSPLGALTHYDEYELLTDAARHTFRMKHQADGDPLHASQSQ